MYLFNTLLQKISYWCDSSSSPLKICGILPYQWAYFLQNFSNAKSDFISNKSHIIICPTIEVAESFYLSIKTNFENHQIFLFPGLEESPYGGIFSSEKDLFKRFKIIDRLIHDKKPALVVCTYESFLLKLPPKNLFLEEVFTIKTSDIISTHNLASKLVNIGYSSSTTVEEPGTFSSKGEIFDIFPVSGVPVRIQYFDEMIEEIHTINFSTGKTERDNPVYHIHISCSPNILVNKKYRAMLRENIPVPKPQFKNRYEHRKRIFSQLSDNRLFGNYPSFVPLFFNSTETIADFINTDAIVSVLENIQTSNNHLELLDSLRAEFERENADVESDILLSGPSSLYTPDLSRELEKHQLIMIDGLSLSVDFDQNLSNKIELKLEKSKDFLNRHVNQSLEKFEYLKTALLFLKDHFSENGNMAIATENENSKNEIMYLLELNEFSTNLMNRIDFINMHLDHGFYHPKDKFLLLTDSDLFSKKHRKTRKNTNNKNTDLFAEQLSTIKKGDYVIHSIHGIGEYLGLESMEIGGNKTDYIVIMYQGNDKIYLPVYKMNMIQKHSDSSTNVRPANLRKNKFEALKSKAKISAKKLAFDLLKLHAERETSQAFAFSPPEHLFNEFELAFQFRETSDQSAAIDDVIDNMQKPLPMDHLVCGDVGFGKTEVAMRAAFKAVLDKKQVAILVPTTILALQHYNSFSERFKNFAVNIEFISRFKSPNEIKTIRQKLEKGDLDIIIGTHKLLGNTIKFHDLGLVVVDEEQRFGVGHKEKLKLLKSSVDFLTLTATPIPRTLQMAFLGIRDLSIIQTAPPKRQSIKSYMIKEDENTIKTAIEREISRGGQVFYVHNRVQDMEKFHQKIKDLVPNAKIVIAHGQLPEKELETRINAFYSGKYQILLTTTIIESGLDIPNANTMIIDRADRYGLAQLHQLRGRIGRSEKKAYAYFVIPKTHSLTATAEERLKALQTYADIGSGFSIASCDLEIRGAGDILGASQSGHISDVGLELYMELLKDAIQEIKGEKKIIKSDIEVSVPFSSYIPNNYISDPSERLKYYKKLSNCTSIDNLLELKDNIGDIFGIYPPEVNHLFTMLEVRIHLQHCGLKSIQVAGNIISLKFDQSILDNDGDLRNNVVQTFISRPKVYQITPDYRVVYTHKTTVNENALLAFSKEIAQQIITC